jgi:hypothetical protein
MAQKRALYGLFLGADGRLSLATKMSTPVDLPSVFGTRGGMLNRITLPLNRLNEVLSFAGINFVPGEYLYADNNGLIVAENLLYSNN